MSRNQQTVDLTGGDLHTRPAEQCVNGVLAHVALVPKPEDKGFDTWAEMAVAASGQVREVQEGFAGVGDLDEIALGFLVPRGRESAVGLA